MSSASKRTLLFCGFFALLFGFELNAVDSLDSNRQNRTVLAVLAHPDDELTVAPILARLAREGNKVYLAVATDGRGGVTEHADIPAGDSLARVRSEELRCAAKRLGIELPIELGLEDGFSHESPDLSSALEELDRLHTSIRKLFERLEPDVVITMNPAGGYGHPDHRAVSSVVTEVYQLGEEGWPKELAYSGMSTDRLRSIPEPASPFIQWVFNNWHGVSPEYLPVRLSYEDQDTQKARESLGCHRSQFTSEAVVDISEIISHVYSGTVTFRPFSGDGATVMELLE